MKRKKLLVLLTAVCLFSCQQQDDEQQGSSKEAINFTTAIDNGNITDILTRSASTLGLPVKTEFSTGDVVSMSVSDQGYSPFAIGVDSHSWDEVDATSGVVTFYAHYPELSEDVSSTRAFGNRYREIKGGKEHLFGIGQALPGSKNVALRFKRVTVPVILLDEEGRPYKGKAKVKFHLRNKGKQNLFDGNIELDKDAEKEIIDINTTTDGELTHLIPQEIEAGEKIGTIIVDGVEEDIITDHDVNMMAGRALTLKLPRGIIDDRTPLR